MKPIKFDLKLNNGETLATLDDLKNNLSPELFEHFQSGKLAKWLRVRKLEEQANAVEKLLSEIHDREVQSFKGLIELFGGETDVDSLRTAIAERKKMLPSAVQNSDDEVEQLVIEIETLKAEIAKLEKSQITIMCGNTEVPERGARPPCHGVRHRLPAHDGFGQPERP